MLAFDVASIKPYGPNDMMITIRTTPDGVRVTGMPMHMILREAFDATNDRLLGEPEWVNSNRYDVEAKVAPEDSPKLKLLSNEQRWAMLLPVLEDRCKLRFHHETKELTVYSLLIAKGGPKLQPAGDAAGAGVPGPGPNRMTANAGGSGMTFMGRSATMDSIVHMIARTVGSTVIDETGLTGKYDYTLRFAPDDSMRAGMPPAGMGGAPQPESDAPSIFTAVQEQLGLKLVAQKQAVDVIVIDHMEQPTEN